jgi:uncharacterized membrane protein YgcG
MSKIQLKAKFISLFSSFILIVSLLFAGLGIDLKTQAFGTNKTDSLAVVISTDKDAKKITLTYQIWQTFNESSHGIFLALPKNQAGIWTEYTLKSVKRSAVPLEISNTKTFPKISSLGLDSDKYEYIKEWDQFRVRVGDKNTTLLKGQYYYEMVVDATYDPAQEYDFTVIHDWTDPVKNLKVIQNEQDLCQNELVCNPSKTAITLNKGSAKVSSFYYWYNKLWPFVGILLIGIVAIYYAWLWFAKDQYKIDTAKSPEFEPPAGVYPWQAAFLANDGNVSVKNTLLCYILWLSNQKYLKLEPDGDPNDKDTEMKMELLKELPADLLPKVFNSAVTLSIDKGLKKGIYASKINESQDLSSLYKVLNDDLKGNYIQTPLPTTNKILVMFLTGFALIFGGVFLFQALQSSILLGDSFIGFWVLISMIVFVMVMVVAMYWSRATREGAELINQVKRYKYYLKYVEKFKLDFSNNPDQGVQYYLKSVAFAAAFGVLAKFQKYFDKLLPNTSEINQNSYIYNSYSHVIFYVPPSSSSGGGSGGGGGGFSGGGGSW